MTSGRSIKNSRGGGGGSQRGVYIGEYSGSYSCADKGRMMNKKKKEENL